MRKVTLKLVAQYGDACNVNGNLAQLRHKFDVMRQHCEAVGRDYQSIYRTSATLCVLGETDEEALAKVPDAIKAQYGEGIREALVGSPETIRQRIAAYEAVGVQELMLAFLDVKTNLDEIRGFARECIQ